MGHESYLRHEAVQSFSNRSFGLTFAVVFALIALAPLFHGSGLRIWALVLGGFFLQFGLLLHRIVSPIMLAIMFFMVITPIGLLMRTFGKDPLRLAFDKDSHTYWIDRTPPGPPPESLTDQF